MHRALKFFTESLILSLILFTEHDKPRKTDSAYVLENAVSQVWADDPPPIHKSQLLKAVGLSSAFLCFEIPDSEILGGVDHGVIRLLIYA